MLIGKTFKLSRPTSGVTLQNGTASILIIPAGEIIRVVSGPHPRSEGLPDKGLVYVTWEERTVALFAIDVEMRGIEVKEPDCDYQSGKSARA